MLISGSSSRLSSPQNDVPITKGKIRGDLCLLARCSFSPEQYQPAKPLRQRSSILFSGKVEFLEW